MGKENLKEEFKMLNELIRTAYQHLDPVDKYSYLYHRNMLRTMYGDHPKCFVRLRRDDGGPMGQPKIPYVLPLCNRAGYYDPDIIGLSIKMVRKLMHQQGAGKFGVNDLQAALDKLDHYHNRYSKPVPKPHDMAGRKANISRMFHNIGNHLKKKV